MNRIRLNHLLQSYKSTRIAVDNAEIIGNIKRYGIQNTNTFTKYSQTLLYLRFKEDILSDVLNNGF